MEFTYERIGQDFCERAQLIEWETSALLERGKFLPLLYSWTTKKFGCSANFAVSAKSKSIGIISSDGELSIMQIKDDKMVLKSQVRVLSDPYPEFRLIQWNNTETLLFATRSSAIMDVFESNGMFLYKIPMRDEMDGSLQIISQIRSNTLTDDMNFSDDVFTLQIDGTFAAFRVGKEAYHRLFTVNLGPAPLCSMVIVPRYNIVVSCGEFQRSNQSEDDMESSAFGMNIHRILKDFPYVDCLKQSVFKKAWHERIPFLSDKKSVVVCAEISPEQRMMLAVTSVGDLLLFALPSLKLLQSTVPLDQKTAPIQVQWITEDSFVVLHSNGQITQTDVNDYFNGVSENHEINLLENCKHICTTNDATTYALTEIRLDNIVTPEENKQRVGAELSLFVIFYLSFLLKFVKAFFSFFFGGDATRDLNEVVGVEQSAKLSLYTTKSLSLNEYIDKCMSNRNYQLAISLAESSESAFDLDIIYKRQWEDLKQERAIKGEDLEVLRFVHDKTWVIEECLRSDVMTNLQLHENLMSLAAVVSKSIDNEKLQKRILNAAQILAIIRLAVPRDEDACELYLRFRHSTILAFAFAMSEETKFDLLNCLFDKHRDEFRNYLLLLLNSIPESTEPAKYAHLLPYSHKSDIPAKSFALNERNGFLPAEISKVSAKYANFSEFLLGQKDTDETLLFERWCQQRVEAIDMVSGLNDDCVAFLDLAVEHGCDSLKELRDQYKLYNDFILFSASTTITFKQFINSDANTVQSTLASHITKTRLLDSLEQTVQLIEFADKDRGKAVEQVLSLVCAHSTRSFEILYALKKIRPNYLTTENLVQCFICSEVVGDELTKAMRELGVPGGLVTVVEFCAQVKSVDSPTFAEIHSAISDSNKATKLISQFVHGNCVLPNINRTDEWWRDLLAKSRQLRQSAFEKVVTDEQVLRFICTEMLSAICRDLNTEISPSRQAPFHLVVDLSGTAASANIQLLKQTTFEELIVEKSKDFVDSAIPDLDDANLKRASIVLEALRSGARLPRQIAAQKRAIDIITLSLELGSKRVPATFAYCNKEILLSEIVNTKNNYRNVKPCAELAKLLELTTPSARALSISTTCALQREDLKTVQNYVKQLAKSSRDFTVVYELAKTLLAHNLDDTELNDDALACLIHNCPEDDLNSALGILSELRSKKANQKQTLDSTSEPNDISYPDPVYTSIKKLHLFNFDEVNSPLKIPLHTYQNDVLMCLENGAEAEQRIKERPDLREIVEAVKVLRERQTHPFILENLNSQQYRQIAVRFGNYVVEEDKLESDEDEIEETNEPEDENNSEGGDETDYEN